MPWATHDSNKLASVASQTSPASSGNSGSREGGIFRMTKCSEDQRQASM